MTQIELRTRIGPDGILTLSVPVGMSEANREVEVIVEPADVTAQENREDDPGRMGAVRRPDGRRLEGRPGTPRTWSLVFLVGWDILIVFCEKVLHWTG